MNGTALLRQHGIRTTADLDRLRGNDSRYGYLRKNFGEAIADQVMRNLEVGSWDLPGPKYTGR
jgi:hypothetical protein